MFCESSRICEPIEGIGQFNIDVVTLRLLLQCYLNAISLIGSYANRSAEDQSDVFE